MPTATYYHDRTAFANRAIPYLMQHEAHHNLLLGLIDTIINHPTVYPNVHLIVADDDTGATVGVALQTPPYPVQLSQFRDHAALPTVAEALLPHAADVTGIGGFLAEAEPFAHLWGNLTNTTHKVVMPQLLYRLDTLAMPDTVPGLMRMANANDLELISTWMIAFEREALGSTDHANASAAAQRFVSEAGRGMALWLVDGHPVAMAGYGAMTEHGVRISAVYTPDHQRAKGYAKAITAALCHHLMTAHRRRFCVLYTDAANPASNAAYRRIGFYPIAESTRLELVPAT